MLAIYYNEAVCQTIHINSISKNIVQIETNSRSGSGVIVLL